MDSRTGSKPEWLKIRPPKGDYEKVKGILKNLGVNTVCAEAACPNACKCWGSGTATFMLLGRACTRRCGFCNVKSAGKGEQVDSAEPEKIAKAVGLLGLRYAVLTSVDRDDLHDFGSGHFAECVRSIKQKRPETIVEVLIPDFQGSEKALRAVLDAKPDVLAHNVETVKRLQEKVRDKRASYGTSLRVLEMAKEIKQGVLTKSGFMLGLGENDSEVMETLHDLRSAGADFLTIGQYLRPTQKHLPVVEYVRPEKFAEIGEAALEMGFKGVASAPFVRSSYLAAQLYADACNKRAEQIYMGKMQ